MRLDKLKIVLWVFILTPVWWLLGLGFFVFHLTALYMLFLDPAAALPRDKFQLFLLLLILTLGLSLGFNFLLGEADLRRSVAALNNLSIQVMGYIYYGFFLRRFGSNPKFVETTAIAISKVSFLSVIIGTGLLYFVVTGRAGVVSYPTLFGLFTPPMDNLLGMYQRASIISTDWFAESTVPRLTLFSTNATASGALIAIAGYIALAAIRDKPKPIIVIFLLSLALTIAATLTRGAFLGLLMGVAVFTFNSIRKKYRFLVATLAPFAIAVGFSYAVAGVEQLSSARQASNETRFASYIGSFEVTMKENPLIGIGVKPRDDSLSVPIGSHSTIFSILVRGGLIGVSFAVYTFLILPLSWFIRIMARVHLGGNSRFPGNKFYIAISAGVPSFIIFCLFQDIDAYAPVSAILFTYLAFLSFGSKSRNASPMLSGGNIPTTSGTSPI